MQANIPVQFVDSRDYFTERVKTLGLASVKCLIGWHVARVLSITECKQGSDWLLASPHWAA